MLSLSQFIELEKYYYNIYVRIKLMDIGLIHLLLGENGIVQFVQENNLPILLENKYYEEIILLTFWKHVN